MTNYTSAASSAVPPEIPEPSLFALGAIVLRRRRWIVGLGLTGVVIGVASGLLRTQKFAAGTVFIPQASESQNQGLALAASQLGIRIPNAGSVWGPPVYVELLGSSAVLDSIAHDTVVVNGGAGHRVLVLDLLNIAGRSESIRTERAVRALRRIVVATEDKKLSAVRLTVTTPWPELSLSIVQHLVREVDRFNLETRKSQAGAERQFADGQARDAESALRQAEDRAQAFLQTNRVTSSSPQLEFERDRLQRDITIRQQVYTSLVQNREEARMREVRDIPTITVLEAPRLPAIPESRNIVLKGLLGGIVGGLFALIFAFIAHVVNGAKASPTSDSREFFLLVEQMTPRFLGGRSHV